MDFEMAGNLMLVSVGNMVAAITIICVYTIYFTSGVQVLPQYISSLTAINEITYEI